MARHAAVDIEPVDPTRRIAFLEVVRGIAAVLVVVHHVIESNFVAYNRATKYVDPGRVGVVAFFLVSGYIIPLSLASTSVRAFAVRRFFRLYPVYWVALAGILCLTPSLFPGQRTDSPSIAVFGLNILMLNGLVGSLSILSPAWTLTIELLFYVQEAAAKARGWLDRSVLIGWLWLGLYIVICVAEHGLHHDLPRTLPLLLYIASLGHALHLRDRDSSSRDWIYLGLAGAIVVPLGSAIGADPTWTPLAYDLSTLVGVGLFATLYFIRAKHFPFGFLWLGSISYAVYLFHPVLTRMFERAGITRWPEVGLSVVTVPLLAWILHRFVERPSIAIGRWLTNNPRPPIESSTPSARAGPSEPL